MAVRAADLKMAGGLRLLRQGKLSDEVHAILTTWTPKSGLGQVIQRVIPQLHKDDALELLEHIQRVVVVESSLALKAIRSRSSRFWAGEPIEDYGVVSRRLITDAFVAALVDGLDVGVGFTLTNFRYHGIGTGSTAESAAHTALVTELTTEYTGNVRATGTASQPSANILTSTATNTLDSGTPALREHSVFSANAAGTMFDRSLYASISLDGTVGDGLTSAYSATFTSGG